MPGCVSAMVIESEKLRLSALALENRGSMLLIRGAQRERKDRGNSCYARKTEVCEPAHLVKLKQMFYIGGRPETAVARLVAVRRL